MTESAKICVGAPAPAFEAPDQNGNPVSRESLLGKAYILYFYPRDNTPGCTTEACSFRDAAAELADYGYTVIGVSRDSQKSHLNFIAKQSLNFTLLSDTDESVCRAFGVMKEKMLYGKKHIGIERSTFVIDAQGTVQGVYRGVKAKTHVEELLASLKA